MKAESIKLIKGPLNYTYAKTPASKVFLPIELADEVYNKITPELPKLEKYAHLSGKPIQFAPKGEKATLMNYGTYTTVLRNEELQEKIAAQIYEHVNKVL